MLTNTLGAMLGYACALLYTKLVPKKAKQLTGTNTRPGFVHRMVSMCIDFLLIALVYVPLSILYIFLFYLVFNRPETAITSGCRSPWNRACSTT